MFIASDKHVYILAAAIFALVLNKADNQIQDTNQPIRESYSIKIE